MFRDKIYLASQSPRRRELIRYLFNNTALLNLNFVEPQWSPGESPPHHLLHCVREKWRQAHPLWVSKRNGTQSLLLVADTIVLHRGRVLGKPRDRAEARSMLRALSGSWHTVLTGFALHRANQGDESEAQPQLVESDVRFRVLSDQTIDTYVRSGSPMDKAGAYGLQDHGVRFVERIRGSYTNIIGLPVEAIRTEIQRMGCRE